MLMKSWDTMQSGVLIYMKTVFKTIEIATEGY